MNALLRFEITSDDPLAASVAPTNFADLIKSIEGLKALDPIQRRDLASDLRTAARMLQLNPAAVPCDIEWLNQRLFALMPAAFDISESRFRNIISSVRRAFRLAGLHQRRVRGENGLPAVWIDLLDKADNEGHRAGLRALARHCAKSALPPGQVTDETLAAFVECQRKTRLAAGIQHLARKVARAWNRIAAATAGTPEEVARLQAAPQREQYTLPFDRYPEDFQRDVAAFAERLSPSNGTSIFKGQAAIRRMRPATVKARVFAIRQAAAALVHSGVPTTEFTSLRCLVEPIDQAETILDFYDARARRHLPASQHESPEIVGGQLAMIADTLMIIGRLTYQPGDASLDRLRELRMLARPRQRGGLTGKVRERLLRLIQPHNRSRLLLLAEQIDKEAQRGAAADPRMARRMMAAIAIEILLCCPLRMKNLAGLRLDRHLLRLDPRR